MLEFVSILEVFIHLAESFSLSHFRIEWANKKIRNNKYYEKFSEFEFAVFGFFEQIGLYRDQLTSLLTENFRVA